jgi:4a-hydroxytetrahydrobiopterin dehydratase
MELATKTCVPCRGGIDPISREQAERLVKDIPGWSVSDDGIKLSRRYVFPDFAAAMRFANQVGDIAEREGHHPDLTIGWGYCNVETYTHKIGGLHENDFILAAKINHL